MLDLSMKLHAVMSARFRLIHCLITSSGFRAAAARSTGTNRYSGVIFSQFRIVYRGAPDPDPDPVGSNVSGSGSDPDPVGSEAGSGRYWPDLHNYDIKHHSILSFHQITHDNTELYMKTQ